MIATAHPTPSSAAASFHGAASPSLELSEARQLRDALKLLLRKEQAAMAEFLVALADFDRRRGWEPLGHASIFAFLVAELGLSTSSTYWRKSAAELLQDFPELERHLRQGRLCLTTMAELAKVLTEENKEAVLPRFLGISSREAKEIVAELQPREAPPRRDVVTSVAPAVLRLEMALAFPAPSLTLPSASAPSATQQESGAGWPSQAAPFDTYPESLRAPETEMTHPARVVRRDEVEPLTAEFSRLHFNVRRQVVKKLEAARSGLGHAIRGATNEQVLEAALDLLLEKQAKARGQVKRPRATVAPTPRPTETLDTTPTSTATSTKTPGMAENHQTSSSNSCVARPEGRANDRRTGPRETTPAAVRRAVWERDQGRCQWPLDSGGCCCSTHRLELDHDLPWARGGLPTVEGLRLLCHAHNALAARQAFGARTTGRYARSATSN